MVSFLTDLDETLKEALAVLDLDINIPEWNMPEITLDYSEIPDEQLIPAADGQTTGGFIISHDVKLLKRDLFLILDYDPRT